MEDTLEETKRPLLELMRSRSFKDWGEAPKYNKEYRQIRWPAGFRPEQPYPVLENGRLVRTSTPLWRYNLRFELNTKTRGLWNLNRSGSFSNYKRDTSRVLMQDIRICMRNNIPFKTKTYEYDPKTTTLYVGETGEIRYSLITGRISSFTYGGVYDKRMNLMLRRFSIYVVKKCRKLIYTHTNLQEGIEVGLNQEVIVPEYDPSPSHRISQLMYVQSGGSTIINQDLNQEYRSDSGYEVSNRPLSNRQRPYPVYGGARRVEVPTAPVSEQLTWPTNITWQTGRDPIFPPVTAALITVPIRVNTTQPNTGDTFVPPTVIQNAT